MSIWSSKEIKQLKDINDRLDRLFRGQEKLKDLLTQYRYVTPELERAIVAVSRRAGAIDRQVEDLP